MPAYDDNGFAPPAPVARVVLRHPDLGVSLADVRMLIDSGADATLLPRPGEATMPIELTEQQQQALDASGEAPPRVIDPRTSDAYVLVPATDYEAIRETLEDERRQRALRAVALRNAANRLGEEP